jgi:septum formation protein
VRLILGSASPARLATLRSAGLDPEVLVSGVDEDTITASTTTELVCALADAKAAAVAAMSAAAGADLVIGCDSMLDLDGVSLGKPADRSEAIERWCSMRGRSGVLMTGHCVIQPSTGRKLVEVASTRVWFADMSDEEITEYVDTGEPLVVAGAFTIDGLGGPFVERIDGDHHNVVGLSLPLLRRLATDLGVAWPRLWAR